jgi:hypothetical protein
MPGPPHEFESILHQLPLRIGVYVPDDILEEWFGDHASAKQYGTRFECEFKHDSARGEGVFWKWVPAV